ncbi:interferon-induced very large GTPase 1-like, partial [Nannospalax galili]|uniref:interferon-induced very large GTPase 1-like n=1 Tax=Nannospalax galili TaxID=1026970 RepID=UPI000819C0F1
LREAEQPDMQLLLLSVAAAAGYQWKTGIFQPLLGCEEVNFLLDEMQTVQHKYQMLQNLHSYRAVAFLMLTALTATAGVTAISTEEKAQRLALVKQHTEKSLSAEIIHVLTKFETSHDWESLENNLRLLVDGDFEDTNPSLQMGEVKKQLESLCHKKKESNKQQNNENNKTEVMENQALLDLLHRLGLECYYPKKMNRAKFHQIYKTSVHNTQPKSEEELPFYFLQKLLMLDYGMRYLIFKDTGNAETQETLSPTNEENLAFDPYEEFYEDTPDDTNPSATKSEPHIHPMDIQMALFHCADNFARQYILAKLAMCQYALPLIVPNPNCSQIESFLWSLRQIRRSWKDASKSPQDKSYSHKNQPMCS